MNYRPAKVLGLWDDELCVQLPNSYALAPENQNPLSGTLAHPVTCGFMEFESLRMRDLLIFLKIKII